VRQEEKVARTMIIGDYQSLQHKNVNHYESSQYSILFFMMFEFLAIKGECINAVNDNADALNDVIY
jgi:phosphate starvation-inducible membrane PsiE